MYLSETGSRAHVSAPSLAPQSPSRLTILLALRVGLGNIVWVSAINAAAAHLVSQERHNGDDHHSGHQKRRREYAQVLHQPDAPLPGPARRPRRGALACADLPEQRASNSALRRPGDSAAGLRRADFANKFAAIA